MALEKLHHLLQHPKNVEILGFSDTERKKYFYTYFHNVKQAGKPFNFVIIFHKDINCAVFYSFIHLSFQELFEARYYILDVGERLPTVWMKKKGEMDFWVQMLLA
ncbi:hypothetical protein J1605_005779 [Eschrichtius robustus]|uniref:Uncharacterized protein n=1 Tax=Eschrichtius robustus TaxID=9764 RepID=A0AB34H5V6_ESCRO|nr:hypothetical protein J1605_005779 [Eschrichtius robustus]